MIMMGANQLLATLQALEGEVASGEMPVLRVLPGDPVNWRSFPDAPGCTLPGIDVGQVADLRYPIVDSEQGLHLQQFADGRVELHLDEKDGCRSQLDHLVADTQVLGGAAIGAIAALILGAATGSGKAALGLLAAGAGFGAVVGAHVPKRKSRVYLLRDLLGGV